MKINFKLTILLVSLACIPLLFFGLVGIYSFQDSLTTQELNALTTLADLQKDRIQTFIENNKQRLNLILSDKELVDDLAKYNVNKDQVEQRLISSEISAFRTNLPAGSEIVVIGNDGKVIASTKNDVLNNEYSNIQVLNDEGERNTFLKVADNDKGDEVLFIAGRFIKNNKQLGQIVIEGNDKEFLSLFDLRNGLGKSGELTVAERNQNGDAEYLNPVLFASGKSRVVIPKNDDKVAMIQALNKVEKTLTDNVDYRGSPVFAVTRYITETDWGLTVKIDKDEVLAPADSLKSSLIALLIIVIVFTSLLAYLTARNLTIPLQRLVTAAKRMAKGEHVLVEEDSADEIGDLQRIFNFVSNSLKDLYGNLEMKVNDKTKELNDKITELETINKNMVGRELKMIELKEELKKLKSSKGIKK